MRLMAKMFSLLLAILAVPMFTLAACNLAIENTFLTRSTYEGVLEDDSLFEDILSVGLPAVLQVASENEETAAFTSDTTSPVDVTELLRILNPNDLRNVSDLLIPADWLQARATELVDSFLAFVEDDYEPLETIVDVTAIQSRFTGDEGREAATIIIMSSPECTRTQLDALATYIARAEGQIPLCKPETEAEQQTSIDLIVAWLSTLSQQLGSQNPTFESFYNIDQDTARVINLFVELDRQSLVLTYLCPMALLSLIVIFTIRSSKSFGRWMGIVSVSTGVCILALILGLQIFVIGSQNALLNTRTSVEDLFSRLISPLIRAAFAQSSSTMLSQAALFIGVGFVLLAIAWLTSRSKDEAENSMVIITDDGQVISTATSQRIGNITSTDLKTPPPAKL